MRKIWLESDIRIICCISAQFGSFIEESQKIVITLQFCANVQTPPRNH